MSLIDSSYFVVDLNIPNSDDASVLERINWTISKREPEFLQKLLGYPLYKAFAASLAVVAPATPEVRMVDLLYGKEYTNRRGYLTMWKGIIKTSNPVLTILGGFVYKQPEYLKSGLSVGFPSGVNTVTFDGTGGAPDWRGWTPIITRIGVMIPNVDYSFDQTTGELVLLQPGDLFGNSEYFFVQFELRTTDSDPDLGTSGNLSMIANYIYFWYCRTAATQSTGYGEVRMNAENAQNDNPNAKMYSAWTTLNEWVCEFLEFMESNMDTYPEFTWHNQRSTFREFQYVNPIF